METATATGGVDDDDDGDFHAVFPTGSMALPYFIINITVSFFIV